MNQTPEVPAGTRCQCQNDKCGPERLYHSCGFCESDAVRLVTVPFSTHPSTGTVEIPVCAACAEYHESKVAR